MRSAGDVNNANMAALLDHADSDGLLRDSGAGDSQTMHSTWVSTWTGEQLVVTKEEEKVYVECSSGIIGRPRYGGTRWHESDLERQASRPEAADLVEFERS